jgi:LytS/YehU family sensor histidine kinase
MPPMMLLPLIDHAVVHGLAAKPQAGAMIQIVCAVTDDRLSVTVVDSGAGFVSETGADGIASIRERLTALYGANARLDLRQRSDQASEAVMEIPCELADASVS